MRGRPWLSRVGMPCWTEDGKPGAKLEQAIKDRETGSKIQPADLSGCLVIEAGFDVSVPD